MTDLKPDETWSPLARALFEMDSDSFTFEVDRTPERSINRNNTTFSEESIDFLREEFTTLVMARLAARWQRDQRAPMKMRIHVDIDFGDANQREQ